MAGKRAKRKGYRGENELVHILRQYGIPVERVPLSGASEFQKGDLVLFNVLTAEVKRRKDGFKELYKWLKDRNLVFLRADRKDWIVAMDIEFFIMLLRRYETIEHPTAS